MLRTFAEIVDEIAELQNLPASNPDSLTGFERDDAVGGWSIWWGGYDYWIDDDYMRDTGDLLDMIEHLGRKQWKGITPRRISLFIEAVRSHLSVQPIG